MSFKVIDSCTTGKPVSSFCYLQAANFLSICNHFYAGRNGFHRFSLFFGFGFEDNYVKRIYFHSLLAVSDKNVRHELMRIFATVFVRGGIS